MTQPQQDDLPRLGRYQVLNKLAQGGMAEIFVAKALGVMGFERLVAIKLIHSHLTRDSDFIKMFIDEARIAMHLHHRNIVQVFDLDKANDTYFIAMEFVHGVNLYDVYERIASKGRWVDLPLSLYLIAEVCKGLHFAHTRMGPDGRPLAIVHRDISPQNILMSFEGEVKITDFGIAKAAERLHQTTPGIVKGKYAYMAPEVLQDCPADARVDVFAAGVVLYELLVGENPFAGGSAVETIENVLNVQVPKPTDRGAAGTAELDNIVLKALAKDPKQRFQSAQALADALTEHGLNLTMARRDIASGDQSIANLLAELFPEKANRMPTAVQKNLVIPLAQGSVEVDTGAASRALGGKAGAREESQKSNVSVDYTKERTLLQMTPVEPPARIEYDITEEALQDDDSTSLDLRAAEDPAAVTQENRAVARPRRLSFSEPVTDQDLQALVDIDEDHDSMGPEDRTVLSANGFLAQQLSMDSAPSAPVVTSPAPSLIEPETINLATADFDATERPTDEAPPAPIPYDPYQQAAPLPSASPLQPPQPRAHPMTPQPPMPHLQPQMPALPQHPITLQDPASLGMVPALTDGSMPGALPPSNRRTSLIAAALVFLAAIVVAVTLVVRHTSQGSSTVTIPITSSPTGATVTINGAEQASRTPLNARVPVGRSHLIVISMDGYSAYTKEIRPLAGSRPSIHAVLSAQ